MKIILDLEIDGDERDLDKHSLMGAVEEAVERHRVECGLTLEDEEASVLSVRARLPEDQE